MIVSVWYDREIITGNRWAGVIETKIRQSSAVIVVMTPAGGNSEWVEREIIEAEDQGRPILPLLLAGRRYMRLANIQYEDVTSGALPPPSFVSELRSQVSTARSAVPDSPELIDLRRRHELALRESLAGRYAELRGCTRVWSPTARISSVRTICRRWSSATTMR